MQYENRQLMVIFGAQPYECIYIISNILFFSTCTRHQFYADVMACADRNPSNNEEKKKIEGNEMK